MKITDDELARLVKDRIAAPDQRLQDSMILCGIEPERFTGAEMAEIHRGIEQAVAE